MQLKQMLSEISKLKQRTETKIPENNGTTVQGHLSRKRSAELRIPELQRDYKMGLIKHIVPIVVTGASSKEFIEIATNEIGILSVDGESLYKDLMRRMPKEASSGKMSPKVVIDILTRHFMDIASECEIAEYPEILYKHSKAFAINNTSDLERLIKKAVTENVGAEMTLIYNLKTIAEKAMDMEFDGGKAQLPVLVQVSDETLVDSIVKAQKQFVGSSHLLISGEVSDSIKTKALNTINQVTKETVAQSLKAVKTNMKKGKSL